jgi:hypothetical protein
MMVYHLKGENGEVIVKVDLNGENSFIKII